MRENIKNEIRDFFASFDKAGNGYAREYMATLFDYLSSAFKNDDELKKMSREIENKMYLASYDRVLNLLSRKDQITEYIDNNKDFFYENIITPEKFTKVSAKSIFPLEEENVSYILKTFFLSISEDLFLFYEKLNDEGRILYGPSSETSFTSLDNSNTIIFIKELEDLIDMLVLVHEIGHAYYFHLNNVKLSDRENIEDELKDEIPAKIMEAKFIEFLRTNGVYEQSVVLGNVFDYVYYEYSKKKYDFESLKYIIASDIAITMGIDVNLEEYYKHIYENNIRKLVLETSEMKNGGKRYYK